MWHSTRLLMVCGCWSVALASISLLVGAALGDDPKCLQVGDSIPEFQCLDDQGKTWDSRECVGKHLLVIYFYPSDFAFCCTSQAKRYRDCQRELADQGVKLIGVSGDTVLTHGMFKTACSLNFPLLADVDGSIAGKFGVPMRSGGKAMLKDAHGKEVVDDNGQAVSIPRRVTAARCTMIIGKDGRILKRQTDVSPLNDSQEVLKFVCSMAAK